MQFQKYVAFSFAVASLFGQSSSVIVGADYLARPARLSIAPGQLVTLLLRGIKAEKTHASGSPLPTELAGVTATIEEPSRGYRARLPILRIDPVGCGSGMTYVCDVTAITVQIPSEVASGGQLGSPQVALRPVITVTENGVAGFRTEFELSETRTHLLNDCDLLVKADGGACASVSLATHADGSMITTANPGKVGEVVVLYAVGLGPTTPVVPTGQAAPSPSPMATKEFFLRFSATNSPVGVDDLPREDWPRPLFVGLVPGFVGLYQVNLQLPLQLPAGSGSCRDGNQTNLRVLLAARSSSNTAEICVAP